MRVLRTNLLVKKLAREQSGAVLVPDSIQDDWVRGEVLSLGPDVKGDIKVGNIVIFPPFMYGREYPEIGEEGQWIIPEELIWAVE